MENIDRERLELDVVVGRGNERECVLGEEKEKKGKELRIGKVRA